MRRIAAFCALAVALGAASTAGAAFRPIKRDFGERSLPILRVGVVHVPPRQRQGLVRVIVRLPLPPLATAHGRELSSTASTHRLNVRSAFSRAYLVRVALAQQAAVAQLRRAIPQARVGRRFRIILDGITVTLPARKLPQLVRLGFADEVYPSIGYSPTLDSSPQIIDAPQLTQATGDAGQGIKIAVVDTGVDPKNPFFDPSGYTYPAGFPKGGRKWTTRKVIVARVFPGPGSGRQGRRAVVPELEHGTHVAGIAAGIAGTDAPRGSSHPLVRGLSGVAPRAWIGNYRVFTVPTLAGPQANTPEILAAFEAAVADGMNVINFSGGGPMTEPANDALNEAIANVAAAGVVPVIAAGNDRDDFGLGSVGSPGTAPDAISVAAVTNSHIFAQALTVTAAGAPPTLTQVPFEGAAFRKAPPAWASSDQTLADVRSIVGTDGKPVDRYLCAPPGEDPNAPVSTLPAGSLRRAIVLAWRGSCSFVSKAQRARAAGAAGLVVVDNRAGDPNPIPVELPLPTGMISDLDGARLDAFLSGMGGRTTIRVGRDLPEIVTGRSGIMTSFSSAGPTAFGHQLKPDISAPGSEVLSSTPPAATGSTFSVLSGTSMASPHIAGAAALLLERHPSWSAGEVKSALVSTAGPAWADTARSREAPVLLEGGGLADVMRADDPRILTEPVSLSFGDLNVSRRAQTRPLLLAVSDAGNGSGDWQIELRPQSATAGASLEVQPTVTLSPGATTYVPVAARATADAAVGDEYGFVVVRQGAIERRVPYFFSVTRPGLPLAPAPVQLAKLQGGDTRVGDSHVSVYRYPAWPFGAPPTYSGAGMDESGSEHVYKLRVTDPIVNAGVSVLAESRGALVHPWLLGSLDENDVQGYAGTPVNVNPISFDASFDTGAAGVVFPRRQTFYIAVDSGSDRLTGRALRGRYVLNAWVDDIVPPQVALVTRRVAAGRPLVIARAVDLGAGVDPLSLVLAYKRVLLGASLYDPGSGFVLFSLPNGAPRLDAGRTPAVLIASDYQEGKNVDTLGGAVLPNTTFEPTSLKVVNGPAVTWLEPEAGACVRARTDLLVTASSTRRLRSVRFLADGRQIGVVKGSLSLLSRTWRTRGATRGRHVLTAIATDAAGKTASARRAVRICRAK